MKTVTKIQTRDGVLHDNEASAKRHANKVYADALSTLAAKLVKIEKYSPMMDFLDTRLDDFIELRALADDTVLEPINESDATP